MLTSITFFGGPTDSNGIPSKFARYLIIEGEIGNNIYLATISRAIEGWCPLPANTVFSSINGQKGDATNAAIKALKSHSQLAKMKCDK